MNNESDQRGMASMGAEPARPDRMRMKAGYGRESVGQPDDTGIRRGDPGNMGNQSDVEKDGGQPSRQTSTAKDMSGQV